LASVRNAIKSAFKDSISLLGKEKQKIMSEDIKKIREMLTSVPIKVNEECQSNEREIKKLTPKCSGSLNSIGSISGNAQKNKLALSNVSGKESLHQLSQVFEFRIEEEIEKRISSVETILKNINRFVVALESSIPKIISDSEARMCTSVSNVITSNLGVAVEATRPGSSVLQLQINRLTCLISSIDGKLQLLLHEYENQKKKSIITFPRWVYTTWVIAASTGLLEVGFLLYGLLCMCRKSSNNFFVG